jgi:hypothetical protein
LLPDPEALESNWARLASPPLSSAAIYGNRYLALLDTFRIPAAQLKLGFETLENVADKSFETRFDR